MSLRPPVALPANIREFSLWCSDQVTAWKASFVTNVISPAQITADQDDYSPTGFSDCGVMRISSDAENPVGE